MLMSGYVAGFFFFQAEDGIRDRTVTGVQTCALPISPRDKMGFGWKISDFRGDSASFHTGSADTFYAIATLVPSRDIGVAVFANAGGERSEERRVGKECRCGRRGGV